MMLPLTFTTRFPESSNTMTPLYRVNFRPPYLSVMDDAGLTTGHTPNHVLYIRVVAFDS